jgi:hypothetical protein
MNSGFRTLPGVSATKRWTDIASSALPIFDNRPAIIANPVCRERGICRRCAVFPRSQRPSCCRAAGDLRSTDQCGARETDPKLHRFINCMFLRMIASAESEPLSAAAAMTCARRWKSGWTSSRPSPGNRFSRTAELFRLDLAPLPVTMAAEQGRLSPSHRHGRAKARNASSRRCPGRPRPVSS